MYMYIYIYIYLISWWSQRTAETPAGLPAARESPQVYRPQRSRLASCSTVIGMKAAYCATLAARKRSRSRAHWERERSSSAASWVWMRMAPMATAPSTAGTRYTKASRTVLIKLFMRRR